MAQYSGPADSIYHLRDHSPDDYGRDPRRWAATLESLFNLEPFFRNPVRISHVQLGT